MKKKIQLSILNRYIDESEIDLINLKLKVFSEDIYKLAREVAE